MASGQGFPTGTPQGQSATPGGTSAPRQNPSPITPEVVRSNFLQIRQMINEYAREERSKGIRLQLDFDNVSDNPPPPGSTSQNTTVTNQSSHFRPPHSFGQPHPNFGPPTFGPQPPPPNFGAQPPPPTFGLQPPPPTFGPQPPPPTFGAQPPPPNFGAQPTPPNFGAQPPPPYFTSHPPPNFGPPHYAPNIPYYNAGGPNYQPWPQSQWQNTQHKADTTEQDDLAKPYAPEGDSKFTSRIETFECPPKTKVPTTVRTYDGSSDPEDHLHSFMAAAKVERWAMPVWCQMFVQTLSGPARLWFNALPEGEIDSFVTLKKQFLNHFGQQKKCTKDPLQLHYILQEEHETTQAFMDRFKQESLAIADAPEKQRISGFIHGLRPRELVRQLGAKIPITLQETFERCEEYIRGEEAAKYRDLRNNQRNTKSHQDSHRHNNRSNNDQRRWSNSDSRDRSDKQDRRNSNTPYDRSKDNRKAQYTTLIKTPKEVYATEDARFKFKPPRALTGSGPGQNMNKFCDFHQDRGHDTNDCHQLRREIEAAIKKGDLNHLLKETKEAKKQGREKKTPDEKVLMVTSSNNKRTKLRTEDWANKKIDFPKLHTTPTLDPMVIKANMAERQVFRVYLDGGSGSNIMYKHCFDRLRQRYQSQLKPTDITLSSFTSEVVHPVGELNLEVTLT